MSDPKILIRDYFAALSEFEGWAAGKLQYKGAVRRAMIAKDRRALEAAQAKLLAFAGCDWRGAPAPEPPLADLGGNVVWVFAWTTGGYNTVVAPANERWRALELAREKGAPSGVFRGLSVEERTLRIAKPGEVEELDRRFASD